MRLFLLLCFLIPFILGAQQGDGIVFTEGSFAELKAKAKEDDKLIFVDAYTTWCGPCKMMSAKVFTEPEVGAVYNERFINAKIDMEKGEGPELSSTYAVMAYPTYLFIDGNGEIVHRGVGYIPKEKFLALAETADGPNSLGALRTRYEGGDREPDFIRTYIQTLNDGMDRAGADAVVDAYLESQEDWTTEDNVKLIAGAPGELGKKRATFLIENADRTIEVIGSGSYFNTIEQLVIGGYMQTKRVRALPEPDSLTAYITKFAAPIEERLSAHYSLLYFQQTRDYDAYLPAAVSYYTKFPSNDFAELNSVAWNFYEHSEDEAQLKMAIDWAKKSVELNKYYPNMDTLAWLYQKTGQQDLAIATAKAAIELAKAEGLDYSDTEDILEE